jgi:hypothetical protein
VRQRAGPAGISPKLGHRVVIARLRVQQLDRDGPGKLDVSSVPHLGEPIGRHPVVQLVPSGDQDRGTDG